jgi:hypothetical protein
LALWAFSHFALFLLLFWVSLSKASTKASCLFLLAWTCAIAVTHGFASAVAEAAGNACQDAGADWWALVRTPECRAGVAVDWSLGVVRSAALPACGAIFFNSDDKIGSDRGLLGCKWCAQAVPKRRKQLFAQIRGEMVRVMPQRAQLAC